MSVRSYQELETQLLQLLDDNSPDLKERILSLVGVSDKNTFFSQDANFIESIDSIASILLADVDGDGILTEKDLSRTSIQIGTDLKDTFTSLEGILMMDHQKVGIRLLESIILLVERSQGAFQYDQHAMELMVFQLLVWGLLFELPKKNGIEISDEVTTVLVKILINLFKVYQRSDAVKTVFMLVKTTSC